MSHLARIRQQQQSWGRRALGLFAAVWLNLALQPCAMAFEVEDDHDCPHCPPAQILEHGGMHGGMDHELPCADGQSECVAVEDLNLDGRSGQLKLKDAPSDSPVAIAPHEIALPFRQSASSVQRSCHASVHAGAPPPLYILHCAYLK